MTFSKDQKNVSLRLKDVPLDRADLSVHRRLWNNSVGNNLQKPLRVNTVLEFLRVTVVPPNLSFSSLIRQVQH